MDGLDGPKGGGSPSSKGIHISGEEKSEGEADIMNSIGRGSLRWVESWGQRPASERSSSTILARDGSVRVLLIRFIIKL